MFDDIAYASLLRTIQRLTGVDLTQYRQEQMRRRIQALVQHIGVQGFIGYAKLLESEPGRLQEFRDYFTINVTEFFRDAERYRSLRNAILPELLAERPSLRVWSAGCSTGAEPYSVAILLRELAPHGKHRILATDVDRSILARARAGAGYVPAELKNVEPRLLARYFQADATQSFYAVVPSLKPLVEFREHNLLSPPPGRGFDLILCRNVVIYFTNEAKQELYDRLVQALRPGGMLFVGGAEVVPAPRAYGLALASPSFFRKLCPEPARNVPAAPRTMRGALL